MNKIEGKLRKYLLVCTILLILKLLNNYNSFFNPAILAWPQLMVGAGQEWNPAQCIYVCKGIEASRAGSQTD